jgi:hypothetical protein
MSKRPLYTNKSNLPEEVVKAITKDRYTDSSEDPFDYSASTLVAPTQKTVLEKRYPGKLRIMDVVDEYWSFLGSIAHAVLEEAWSAAMGSWSEKRLYIKVLGKVLAGKMDIYHMGTIRDYKMTRVYKILKADYLEWEQQQNIYAQLCRENNWPVHEIKIIVLLRDWNKGEAYKEGYPKAPIVIIPLRVWPEEEAVAFINNKVKELQHAETLSDEELMATYPCSDRDRWADIRGYGVQKPSSQKAWRRFDTMEEAETFVETLKNKEEYIIKEQKSPPTRCNDWCKAAAVCLQHNPKWKEAESVESEAETPIF